MFYFYPFLSPLILTHTCLFYLLLSQLGYILKGKNIKYYCYFSLLTLQELAQSMVTPNQYLLNE